MDSSSYLQSAGSATAQDRGLSPIGDYDDDAFGAAAPSSAPGQDQQTALSVDQGTEGRISHDRGVCPSDYLLPGPPDDSTHWQLAGRRMDGWIG
uniref:Uncharacterized protein n=1 Tax=Vitrella brassicaformis TaxID=1169539 RepID=A0A7S1JYP5_9ALVE